MPATLDLSLIPVARYAGQDYPDLLCLHAAAPPRRAARGREVDRLILYLAMAGNAPLPPGKQDELLAGLAKLYYATPGSATSAMRKVAEELNSSLLERNLRLANSSRQELGVLTQVVLRGQQLFVAQSGPAHAFLIAADEVSHFHDPEMADRGEGQSRVASISFFQAELQPNDTLLLAAQPAAEWNADTLRGLHGQGPESLRRRLLPGALGDVNAVLIQARAGKGVYYLPRPVPPQPAAKPAPPASRSDAATAATGQPSPARTAPVQAPLPPPEPVDELAAVALPVVLAASAASEPDGSTAAAEAPAAVSPATPAAPVEPLPAATPSPAHPPAGRVAREKLAAFAAVLAGGLGRIRQTIHTLLVRMLPEDVFGAIPSSVMAFIALAVPIVTVTVASVVYFRLGRDAQYALIYSQAQQTATQGLAQTDIAKKRTDLEATLALLDKAESYQAVPGTDTQALRQQVQVALDELDKVRRVNYQPAIIGGLAASANVTRIVALDDDLYLLDSTRGSALRARLTSQGYEIDQTFQCGPDVEGITSIGPLIDIAIWPPGYKPQASLLGMDALGNVLYCQSDEPPQVDRLAVPSTDSWGKIASFTLDLGDAYVLDLPSNGLWIYWRSNFSEEPSMFFNDEIPDLQNVTDFTVNRDDLYLLSTDGSLALCTYSSMQGVPTRCSTPAYVDFRPGRENMPLVPAAPFTQIQNTQPPDPSLFLLESLNQAIFHFSLRNLAFQGQYLPDPQDNLPDQPATAFAVDNIRRNLFLAIGSQVYYAVLP
jgi:hypothetical protein